MATFSISGSVGSSGSGATITLSGTSSASTTADGSGNYTFSGLVSGNYLVTPGLSGKMFSPSNIAVVVVATNITAVNFETFVPGHQSAANVFGAEPFFTARIETPKTADIETTQEAETNQ